MKLLPVYLGDFSSGDLFFGLFGGVLERADFAEWLVLSRDSLDWLAYCIEVVSDASSLLSGTVSRDKESKRILGVESPMREDLVPKAGK